MIQGWLTQMEKNNEYLEYNGSMPTVLNPWHISNSEVLDDIH